jgi:hypothetical protein
LLSTGLIRSSRTRAAGKGQLYEERPLLAQLRLPAPAAMVAQASRPDEAEFLRLAAPVVEVADRVGRRARL